LFFERGKCHGRVVEIHLSLRSLGPDAIAGIVSHGAAQIMSRQFPHAWRGSKNHLDGNLGHVLPTTIP